MNQMKIVGYGTALPKEKIRFGDQIRHRISGEETQISLAVEAIEEALKYARRSIEEVDCIISASAVAVQAIPCTAALIHEQIAKGTDIPAIDVNTTCTSFVSALDTFSYLIQAGKYQTILIVSSEVGSLGLNPKQKESFELFSDGAAAVIVTKSEKPTQGMLYSVQKTWSEGAHATEIRGGMTHLPPKFYTEETKEEYMFDMKGRAILSLVAKKLPVLMQQFLAESQLSLDDITYFIPHQASKALPLIMKRLGIPERKYINRVSEYGNMVSASIPFVLCQLLKEKLVKEGDAVVLLGTAAGLTTNILALKL